MILCFKPHTIFTPPYPSKEFFFLIHINPLADYHQIPAHNNMLQPPHHLHSSLSLKKICFLRPQQPSRHLANRHQILACHVLDFHQHPNNITYPDKNINNHVYYIMLFILKMVSVAGITTEAVHSST